MLSKMLKEWMYTVNVVVVESRKTQMHTYCIE